MHNLVQPVWWEFNWEKNLKKKVRTNSRKTKKKTRFKKKRKQKATLSTESKASFNFLSFFLTAKVHSCFLLLLQNQRVCMYFLKSFRCGPYSRQGLDLAIRMADIRWISTDYPADEEIVFRMGVVFTLNLNHIVGENNCIYWNHHCCGLISNCEK